jgi:hypothetical protein
LMGVELDETPSGPGPRHVGALSPEGVPGCLGAIVWDGTRVQRVFRATRSYVSVVMPWTELLWANVVS